MKNRHISNIKHNQHTSSKSQHSIRQPLLGKTLMSVHIEEECAQIRESEKRSKEWQEPTLGVRVKVKDSRGVQLERGDCFPSHLHTLIASFKTFSVCLIHTLYPQGQGQSRSCRERIKDTQVCDFYHLWCNRGFANCISVQTTRLLLSDRNKEKIA